MVVKRSRARSRGRRKPAHRLDRYHRRRGHRLGRYRRRPASRRDRYRRRPASRRDRWRKGKNQPGWLVLFYTGCGPIKFVASAIWRGRLKNRGSGALARRSEDWTGAGTGSEAGTSGRTWYSLARGAVHALESRLYIGLSQEAVQTGNCVRRHSHTCIRTPRARLRARH